MHDVRCREYVHTLKYEFSGKLRSVEIQLDCGAGTTDCASRTEQSPWYGKKVTINDTITPATYPIVTDHLFTSHPVFYAGRPRITQ